MSEIQSATAAAKLVKSKGTKPPATGSDAPGAAGGASSFAMLVEMLSARTDGVAGSDGNPLGAKKDDPTAAVMPNADAPPAAASPGTADLLASMQAAGQMVRQTTPNETGPGPRAQGERDAGRDPRALRAEPGDAPSDALAAATRDADTRAAARSSDGPGRREATPAQALLEAIEARREMRATGRADAMDAETGPLAKAGGARDPRDAAPGSPLVPTNGRRADNDGPASRVPQPADSASGGLPVDSAAASSRNDSGAPGEGRHGRQHEAGTPADAASPRAFEATSAAHDDFARAIDARMLASHLAHPVTPHTGAPTQFHAETPVGSRGWSDRIADIVSVAVKDNIQEAEIRVQPRELGPITMRVTVDGDTASVSFVATNADTARALEDGLDRLREVLADGGFELGDAAVTTGGTGAGTGSDSPSARTAFADTAGNDGARPRGEPAARMPESPRNDDRPAAADTPRPPRNGPERIVDTFA